MLKRPELSRIIYTDKQIIVHAFQMNMIHLGNFLPTNLQQITFKPRSYLFLNDTRVGKLQADIYHRDQKSIYLYFENLLPNIKYNNYFFYPEINAKIIQCPICSQYYKPNDLPCECIRTAPFFFLPSCEISKMQILNFKTDNLDSADCRESIYDKFFSRSLHNLKFMEPI